MKIKRFHADSMRDAMRMVREEQGADAVILSNRITEHGVEVVAAVDYDASLMLQSNRKPAARHDDKPTAATPDVKSGAGAEISPSSAPRPAAMSQAAAPSSRAPTQLSMSGPRVATMAVAEQAAVRDAQPRTARAQVVNPPQFANAEMQQLQREMLAMRQLLEQQLAVSRWQDMQRLQPGRAAAYGALVDLGIEGSLALEMAQAVPETLSVEKAKLLPMGQLGKRLPCDGTDPVLGGGTFALVGPTGVGKTTTIAKLAARFAAVHGTRDLALVTMDTYRIGGQEQLFTYGRLIGAPVYSVGPEQSLEQTLLRLQDRKLVLIDTAGVSQRDAALGESLSRLSGAAEPLQTWLVLAANTQIASQEEAVRRFSRVPLAGVVLTKLDETDRVGRSLGLAMRQQLHIKYFADGQRVPEDLYPARADRLVLRAMQLSRRYPAPLDESACVSGFSQTMSSHG